MAAGRARRPAPRACRSRWATWEKRLDQRGRMLEQVNTGSDGIPGGARSPPEIAGAALPGRFIGPAGRTGGEVCGTRGDGARSALDKTMLCNIRLAIYIN